MKEKGGEMKEQMLTVVQGRGNVYDFLAQLFLNPIPTPGYEYVQRFFKGIEDFSAFSDQEDYKEGVRLLKNFKAMANCGNLENIQRQLAVDRTRLCRGTAKMATLIPPYEALYLMPEKACVAGVSGMVVTKQSFRKSISLNKY